MLAPVFPLFLGREGSRAGGLSGDWGVRGGAAVRDPAARFPLISDDLLAELAAPEALHAAWLRVRANKGAAGSDDVSVAAFGFGLWYRLGRLRQALLDGSYRPRSLRWVPVPKRSGGERMLAIPCVVDRIAQTAAATALSERIEPHFHPGSFGYRPARSVAMAVERVRGYRREGFRWVVDADIAQFFDSLVHGRILAQLEGFITDRRFLALVGSWLDGFGPEGVGIAQGSQLSPLLANLYLSDFDWQIEAGGPVAGGVRIVRYADDFVLLTCRRWQAWLALGRAVHLLRRQELAINWAKTSVVPFDAGLTFLGEEITLPPQDYALFRLLAELRAAAGGGDATLTVDDFEQMAGERWFRLLEIYEEELAPVAGRERQGLRQRLARDEPRRRRDVFAQMCGSLEGELRQRWASIQLLDAFGWRRSRGQIQLPDRFSAIRCE